MHKLDFAVGDVVTYKRNGKVFMGKLETIGDYYGVKVDGEVLLVLVRKGNVPKYQGQAHSLRKL